MFVIILPEVDFLLYYLIVLKKKKKSKKKQIFEKDNSILQLGFPSIIKFILLIK